MRFTSACCKSSSASRWRICALISRMATASGRMRRRMATPKAGGREARWRAGRDRQERCLRFIVAFASKSRFSPALRERNTHSHAGYFSEHAGAAAMRRKAATDFPATFRGHAAESHRAGALGGGAGWQLLEALEGAPKTCARARCRLEVMIETPRGTNDQARDGRMRRLQKLFLEAAGGPAATGGRCKRRHISARTIISGHARHVTAS